MKHGMISLSALGKAFIGAYLLEERHVEVVVIAKEVIRACKAGVTFKSRVHIETASKSRGWWRFTRVLGFAA